jgi:uncharacterized protein (DUF427 family)
LLAVIPFAILLHYYNDISFEELKITKAICRYFAHASFYSVTAHTGDDKDLENLKEI